MKITKEDIGKTFQTKGGWTATVVWVTPEEFVWAVHDNDPEEVRKHVADGRHCFGTKGLCLLPPTETKRVRVVLADQREFLPETALCDVDLLDGKIVAVRLVEHG